MNYDLHFFWKKKKSVWNACFGCRLDLPRKASTRQLTPLMALKKICGSCFRHGCRTTSCGMPLELRNCSWNLGVVLTIVGLLRSTGLLGNEGEMRRSNTFYI